MRSTELWVALVVVKGLHLKTADIDIDALRNAVLWHLPMGAEAQGNPLVGHWPVGFLLSRFTSQMLENHGNGNRNMSQSPERDPFGVTYRVLGL